MQMRTRGGGHDYEGLSYLSYEDTTPFFILDMFNLRLIDVNIEQEIAWVEAGATLGEVYYKISKISNTHGVPASVCPTVAVGGHCSRGGYGNMMRKYRLVVDQIEDAKLIDVNGELLDRRSIGDDLFWAITGGGGASFGFPVGTSREALLSRSQQSKRQRKFKIKSDFLKEYISKQGMKSIFKRMQELRSQTLTFNPLGGRLNEISEFAKPYPHRAGNLAMIQYQMYWDDSRTEAANQYIESTRLMHEHMTPYVSKNPRQAVFNYRDLDLGVNHNRKNSYEEGKVYGLKYWNEVNFNKLMMVKSRVDPGNFFRNEQEVPTLESSSRVKIADSPTEHSSKSFKYLGETFQERKRAE
ncbi:berberine/berberine-like protein [Tanacetum coccineum]|uniref:Berberine/berberine-like protein n=1 Tax=Tanacetum coccineum TaxID=301880 RepID=A0ABQ4YBT2_9ASTR